MALHCPPEAKDILDTFSETDHSGYCLAHLFTHYDVPNGVLGLAYVGTTGSTSGGICSQRTTLKEEGASLNTGFTTSLNHGVVQPFLLVSLVTTHEVGCTLGPMPVLSWWVGWLGWTRVFLPIPTYCTLVDRSISF